ncbi:thioester domain-containing protein [Aeromicrobium chenweiae]|uniref:thioester domain-containing protein n=1 Tax=Aeromicrobium chenweiae TaxID=2079793 RepID=UPI00196B6FB4|nr:thioester domain-containing protein [Aeromicrobium chenweiae]
MHPLRVFVVLLMLAGLVLVGRPAHAEPIVGGDEPVPSNSPFTELQLGPITGALGVSNVDAFNAPATFDPFSGYPETIPAGWETHDVAYAGLLPASDSEGNEVFTYCIDLFTSTQTGVTYERGEWTEANVRNLGYVAYILENYYPTVPNAPAGVANNVRAAAVQAAIWYFSDNLVLDPDDEPQLYGLTSAIVADAIANGPATEPEQPTLSVSPESASAPSTGEIVGPFTVTANGPSVLRLEGVEVFTDEAGTQPLAEGATVAPGTQLWARSTSTTAGQGFSLQRLETISESTVYLYDGATPGRNTAQKLILARQATLEAVASVRINRFAAGGLQVTKTISGEGAGLQGDIEINVVCTPPAGVEEDPVERTITIPAGTGAGAQDPVQVTGLRAGSTCTITEPEDGDNDQVNLTASSIDPETVTVVTNVNTPVAVTNEYELAVGGLEVTKTISGEGAGLQGDIEINVVCTPPEGVDVDPVERTITIPAGTGAGAQDPVQVTGVPAGSTCTITEPEDGDNGQVNLTASSIDPETVTVVDDTLAPVAVTNEYELAVGGLEVTKTISGEGAGLQGDIEINVVCTPPEGVDVDPVERTITIPAGTGAGAQDPVQVTGVPAGSTCTITEPEDGDNDQVNLTASSIDPETVTVVDNTLAPVAVTNEYELAVGGLEVTKTISGEGAGLQGDIEINVVCTPPEGVDVDPVERTITIPAGTGAGAQDPVQVTGVPAGSTCTITEPEDGDNGQVNLTASSIDPETVTVVDDTLAPVAVTNEYARAVGGLQVTKLIGGPAAGEQDEIVLALDCDDDGNAFDQEFTIPAGSAAGEYPVTTVTGIPVGTECVVTETVSGETDTIVLVEPTTIEPGSVTIADGETSAVTVTNNYREENGGGGGGGGGGGESGGGSAGSGSGSGFLPSTGAPSGPLGLGFALVLAGATVLIARRWAARKGLISARRVA